MSTSAEHDSRIDYIELPATRIADTKRFYAEAFSWKFTDYGPDYTSFEDGRLAGGSIFSFPGGRRFHFADPSGNELAVWSDR